MVFYKDKMVDITCLISKIDTDKERNGETPEIKTSQE